MPRALADIPNTATITNATGYPLVVYSQGIGNIPAGETETIDLGALEAGRGKQMIRGETLRERVWQAIVGLVEAGSATLVTTVPPTAITDADRDPIFPHGGAPSGDTDVPRPGMPNFHVDPAGPVLSGIAIGAGSAYVDVDFTRGVYGSANGCAGSPDEATLEYANQPESEIDIHDIASVILSGQPDSQVHVPDTGSITISDQPVADDAFTINDGTTTVTFIFDPSVAVGPGEVEVAIGALVADTRANMVTAIQGAGLDLVSVVAAGDGASIEVVHGTVGAEITVTVNVSTFLARVDFAGGSFTQGDGFTIDDGVNPAVTFVYITNPADFIGTEVPIAIEAGGFPFTAVSTVAAIAAAGLEIAVEQLPNGAGLSAFEPNGATLTLDLNAGAAIAVNAFVGGAYTAGDNFTIDDGTGPVTFVYTALGVLSSDHGVAIPLGGDVATTVANTIAALTGSGLNLQYVTALVAPDVGLAIGAAYGVGSLTLNKGVDITEVDFAGGVEGAAPGIIAPCSFALVLDINGGTVTAVRITSVKQDDNVTEALASDPVGGETTLRLFLDVTGAVAGAESITVSPVSMAIVNDRGVVAPSLITQSIDLV